MGWIGFAGLIYFSYRVETIRESTKGWQIALCTLGYIASCLLIAAAVSQWMILQQYG